MIDFPKVTVDGEEIPSEAMSFELSRLIKFYAQHLPEEQIRQQLPLLRDKAVEQVVGQKLLFNEAKELNIVVTDEDVSEQVFKMARDAGGMDKLRGLLAKQNLTEAKLRDQIKRGLKVDMLVEKVSANAPEPTEDEIKAHFENHRDEYSKPARVLAQHILITPDGDTPECKAEARAKLEEIRQRVVEGADFGDEATAHSMCPSGKNGGSLGWFTRGMMVPEFENAAFGMKDGEVSDVIETQFGFHIIYKTDHEDAQAADFDEAHDSVRDFLHHVKRGEFLADHVNDLRKKATVTIS